MSVTASRIFDFLEKCPLHSIERYEIVSTAFSDLRRRLRSIIVGLSESGESDATEISRRLKSILSEWLTVPVSFDNAVLLALKEMGEPVAVESRWGRDISSHYEDACRTAEDLLYLENPVRAKLANIIEGLRKKGQPFRIFCHKQSREHFDSIFKASGGAALPGDVFIHSVAEYRQADPFDVLLKVGPLRSRGWGSAPDALLTAPRFDTLIQVVWSGCSDEPGFGYDPVPAPLPEGDTAYDPGTVTDRYTPSLHLRWKVQESRSRDNTTGCHDDPKDINEFEVFTRLTQPTEVQRATLVQVDEDHGILYPPRSQVLGLDPVTNSVGYHSLGATFLEGMFLILPVLNDAQLTGLRAQDGHFSAIWKKKLNAEYQRDPVALANRLRNAGLQLLGLDTAIDRWCKPSSTVIHAPQSKKHFEILAKVLELDFDPDEIAKRRQAAWWQFAWDEIRRSRGEAIQTGFQEQNVVDNQVCAALRALDTEIRANVGQRTFQLVIPPGHSLQGVFRFYRVLAVEDGFKTSLSEMRRLCDLNRIDQWRE